MKHTLLLLLPILALAGCATQQSSTRGTHPLSREMRQEGVEPAFFSVTDKDTEMRMAVRDARGSVDKFIAALQSPAKTQHDFEVKKPFVQDGNVEHIWLSHVTYSGHRFHGNVDNHPKFIKGLKFGQHVSVNPDEISDWAYIDNGQLVGGYTVRVLAGGMDEAGKKKLQTQGNFRIGNE
ncbi:MAG TPA: DUF2314 domain-containing protein [Chthoniobacteraceae bacterium]|nr:DUF2314 domain-containing protein [Chthoniobacteraceae bacterium]